MGTGINAFQVRYHPQLKSRSFFFVRVVGSADDFSFRKCVDHILPLPENMVVKSEQSVGWRSCWWRKGWWPWQLAWTR
ncbi:hypothetical protein Hanom_Chr07g00597431 [Helianthus anomalus]